MEVNAKDNPEDLTFFVIKTSATKVDDDFSLYLS